MTLSRLLLGSEVCQVVDALVGVEGPGNQERTDCHRTHSVNNGERPERYRGDQNFRERGRVAPFGSERTESLHPNGGGSNGEKCFKPNVAQRTPKFMG
jgi:hypothetical protein